MLEILRTALTLGVMAAFAGIVWWAYAPSRKELWQKRAVLDDDEQRQLDD